MRIIRCIKKRNGENCLDLPDHGLSRKKKVFYFFLCFILVAIAGATASFFTASSVHTWYPYLEKPGFTPPDRIFAPVWTVLYICIAVAGYLICIARKRSRKFSALIVYGIQMVLNVLWSYCFFYHRRIDWALIIIGALLLAIGGTIFLFYRISKPASYLFIPYFLWVFYAALLNFSIFQFNC